MKHKVGSIVKGLQIGTKPKIMIERLMLPQNRDQIVIDDTVDDLSPNNNPLPTIQEEHEMKMFKIAQSLSTCLGGCDSMYPHVMAFTDFIATTKLNLQDLLNSLPTADYSVSTKWINKGGGINSDNRKTDQIVIDDTVYDLSPNNNPLPSIQEEHEDPCFSHLPVRLKRSKLGTKWRQKRKENLNSEATQERNRNTSAPVSCNEDSSESENIPAVIQHVANIGRGVKGPLSSKVGSSCDAEEESVSLQSAARHFTMIAEDPMEGSSWMYGDYCPPHSKERRSSIYKSESSDDEEALIVPKKPTNMSTMNTLVMKNQSFNDSIINKSPSKSESSSTSSSCTPDEPYSTNNVESPIKKTLFTKESKLSCSLSSTSSPGVSTDYGTSNSTIEQQLSKTHNRLSVCLSKVPSSISRLSSDCANRFSEVSLSTSPAQSFVTSRKRVRQPSNRYPIEDYVVPNINKTNSKIATIAIRKNSIESKTTEVRNSKKRLSSRSSAVIKKSFNGCESENSEDNAEDTQNKTKRLSKASLSKKSTSTSKPAVTNGLQPQTGVQGNLEDSENKSSKANISKSKQRLSTKSTCAPKSSINESQLLQNSERENRLSRRNRNNVCYKESPLNLKKRRP